MAIDTTTGNTWEFEEYKLIDALQLSRGLLITPILGTNQKLETVARIVIKRTKVALRHLSEDDGAIAPSTSFAAAWEEFKAAEEGLDYWLTITQKSEVAIHDLKVMYTNYLALKYQRQSYESESELYNVEVDTTGALVRDLDAHLLLGMGEWTRWFIALRGELHQLGQWEQHGAPKSKSPPTPYYTWLRGILELFHEHDTRNVMKAIRFTVMNMSSPYMNMKRRHNRLILAGRGPSALDEIERDLDSLAVWAPKEYDTELLETAICDYHRKIIRDISRVCDT